jgi:hypothetical protein
MVMSPCLVASSIAFYNIPIAPPQVIKSATKLADFSLIKAAAVGFRIQHQQNRDGVIRATGIEINTIRTVAILGLEIPTSEVGINEIELGMITGTGISRRQTQPVSGDRRQFDRREPAIQCLAVVRGQSLSNTDTKSTELKPRSIPDLPSREPFSKRERYAMKVIPSSPWDSTWTARINTEQEPQRLNIMVQFHRKMCFWAITDLIPRYLNPTGTPCSWSLHKT